MNVRFKVTLVKYKKKDPQDMPVQEMAMVQIQLEKDLDSYINWFKNVRTKKKNSVAKLTANVSVDVVLTMYILHQIGCRLSEAVYIA